MALSKTIARSIKKGDRFYFCGDFFDALADAEIVQIGGEDYAAIFVNEKWNTTIKVLADNRIYTK